MTPEQQSRQNIDRLLSAAGWHLFDAKQANIHAGLGVVIREFPLPGHGSADYLFYVAGKAAGVIEAKKEGATLSGVEVQSSKSPSLPSIGFPRTRSASFLKSSSTISEEFNALSFSYGRN